MPVGIAHGHTVMSGWGLKFLDYDNDGNLDLFLANGIPDDLIEFSQRCDTTKSRCCCFINGREFVWRMSVRSAVPFSARLFSSRGLAVGDFNNDGATDLLISVNDAAPVLLRNNAGQNHWLG